MGFAFRSGGAFVVATYAILSFLYSVWLKTFPLVDVFVLAGLYTLRIIAGGVATHHPVSLWLLAFSGFTFLGLACVKRCGELFEARGDAEAFIAGRRGYAPGDYRILEIFGCASAFSSSVVLALFVNSASAMQLYNTPEILWLVVPLILFWQCRLWLATARGYMHDDPIVYAIKDWVSWLTAVCATAIMAVAAMAPNTWPSLME
jgi:4-hydroxybenzoate polyprenyltransferase